jgi:hypothetical protein
MNKTWTMYQFHGEDEFKASCLEAIKLEYRLNIYEIEERLELGPYDERGTFLLHFDEEQTINGQAITYIFFWYLDCEKVGCKYVRELFVEYAGIQK